MYPAKHLGSVHFTTQWPSSLPWQQGHVSAMLGRAFPSKDRDELLFNVRIANILYNQGILSQCAWICSQKPIQTYLIQRFLKWESTLEGTEARHSTSTQMSRRSQLSTFRRLSKQHKGREGDSTTSPKLCDVLEILLLASELHSLGHEQQGC